MYIGSIATTIFLGRAHHTEKRQTLTANPDDTSYPPLDSPKPEQDETPTTKKFSFKNLFRRRRAATTTDPENALAPHPQPSDISPLHRPSVEHNGDENDYVYIDHSTGNAQSDIGLVGGGTGTGGYQRVQERPASPDTIYTEYDPRRPASPPPMPQQFHPQPQQQISPQLQPQPQLSAGDMWRPVDITGGTYPVAGDEMSEARFPYGPYENLRAASMRGGYQGRQPSGPGQGQGQGYRYDDGVYDA